MNDSTRNALNILAKAAELYVGGLDELAKAFAIPQIQSAISIMQAAINTPFGGDVSNNEEKKDELV